MKTKTVRKGKKRRKKERKKGRKEKKGLFFHTDEADKPRLRKKKKRDILFFILKLIRYVHVCVRLCFVIMCVV